MGRSRGPPDIVMQISKDIVVAFHYVLRDASGKEIESSRARGTPQYYLHGHSQIVPGLETALEGRQEGDKLRQMVPADLGYGPREDKEVRVPLKRLKAIKPLRVGSMLTVDMPEGRRVATVRKIGHSVVDLDLNHPLAGQDLDFDVEIVEVRAATEEELAHGHAHPPGMHAH